MGRKASAARRTPPETGLQSAKSLEEWYDHWLKQVKQNGDFVERIISIYEYGIGNYLQSNILLGLYERFSLDIWELLYEDWNEAGQDGVASYLLACGINPASQVELECALTARALQLLLKQDYSIVMERIKSLRDIFNQTSKSK